MAGDANQNDVVYSQNPGANTLVFPRTEVSLVPGVYVPDVREMTRDAALNELASHRLDWAINGSATRETTDPRLVGAIFVDSQDPTDGLYRRSEVGTVRLMVVKIRLAERIVPDVGMHRRSIQYAISVVKQAGLTPVIYDGHNFLNEAGFAVWAIGHAAAGNGNAYERMVDGQDPPRELA